MTGLVQKQRIGFLIMPGRVYFGKDDVLSQDRYVCHCLKVPKDTIEIAVKQKQCHTAEAVKAETKAGTGCMACVRRIKAMIQKLKPAELEPVKNKKDTLPHVQP